MTILMMTDLELEVASQTLIDFMREHDDIYGRYGSGEIAAILGNVMFVFGVSYDAWLHAHDANDANESIDDIVKKGRGIYTDGV
jgi:hypothetical protein